MLGDNIFDGYMWFPTGKDMWGLEAKFEVFDVGNELYVTKQFHDYNGRQIFCNRMSS